VISERQRTARDGHSSLTADSARRLSAQLVEVLERPSWLLDVSVGATVGIASLLGAGQRAIVLGPDAQLAQGFRIWGGSGPATCFVQAHVTALPFGPACVPAAHLGPGLGQLPDWRGALAELSRVLHPQAVLATILGTSREDTLVVEVQTHFRTLLNVMSAWRPAPGRRPTELQRPEQVDRELARFGFGPPRLLSFRGECVLSARDIVEAAMADPALVPAGSDQQALEEVGAKTLTWAAARVGGPDVPLVLGARRAYRIYDRR
jgi:hypothetical protein